MHHGHYGSGGDEVKDHVQAQVDMIDSTLQFGGITTTYMRACKALRGGRVRVLDAGCGVGGSSRHIARKFADVGGVEVTGVSLSDRQVASARARTTRAGLSDSVSFEVANAMELPFPDDHFDVVWSMESGEHMPDKEAFLAEMGRVLKPGGRMVMATWCHRDVDAVRGPLSKSEKYHLKLLCHNYCLPRWVPVATYEDAAHKLGFTKVETDDWTTATLPFWPAVVKSALLPSSLVGLVRAGWLAVRGALTCVLMITGFKRKLLVFALFAARGPASSAGGTKAKATVAGGDEGGSTDGAGSKDKGKRRRSGTPKKRTTSHGR